MTNTFKLHYLNLGTNVNATLSLPATNEEVKEFFNKLNPFDNDIELQWVETELSGSQLDRLTLSQLRQLADMDTEEAETVLAIHDTLGGYFSQALEVFENGDYMTYSDCDSMADVAYNYYEETGQLAELTKHINESYIDFEAIGRDMEIEGTFARYGTGYIQIMA